MKLRITIVSHLLIGCFFISACQSKKISGLEQALIEAGANRQELEKVLKHYKAQPEDSLKYKAAYFLITNMQWHKSRNTFNTTNKAFRQKFNHADSVYYCTHTQHRAYPNNLMQENLHPTERNLKVLQPDLKKINATFLISHIDHIFHVWKTSPFAQNLSFDEFCEYLLPYCCIPNGYYLNSKNIADIVSKQVKSNGNETLEEFIRNYNAYLEFMRQSIGIPAIPSALNWADIFTNHTHDCLYQSEFETMALRACGIPASVSFCVSNREFVGRHSFCNVIDSTGKHLALTAESDYLGKEYWGYPLNYRLNAYQFTYGVQKDSPYMLKSKNERLPPDFQEPTIKDITPEIRPTVSIDLNTPPNIENNLVWLYTYNREAGYIAVTWGCIDKRSHTASFKHVIPGVLYFPAYLDGNGEPCFFTEPLFAQKNEGSKGNWKKLSEMFDRQEKEDVVLNRKFPRKPAMLHIADDLVGSKFYGANNDDKSDKDILYCITQSPQDYTNEYYIKHPKAYRYYIFEPANHQSEMAIIEYLSNKNRDYTNTTKPREKEILSPADTNSSSTQWVKLLPEHSIESAEFDDNVQTSSGDSLVIFQLEKPQVVDCIRAIPQNADNLIHPNEDYELFYWDNGWKLYKRINSKYHFLEFKGLPTQRLYWLKNNTRGKEECPFIIKNGKQNFIYYDLKID